MNTEVIQLSREPRPGKIKKIAVKVRAKLGAVAAEGKYKSKLLSILSFVFSKEGFHYLKKFIFKLFYMVTKVDFEQADKKSAYNKWKIKNPAVFLHDSPENPFAVPTIGVVIHFNDCTPEQFLATLNSLQIQTYPNLVFRVYSATLLPQGVKELFEKRNIQIEAYLSDENGIDFSTEMKEEFVFLVECGDILVKDYFMFFIGALREHPLADVVYSDEDEIDEKGRYANPSFKPEWSPYNLYSRNYLGRSVLIRRNFLGYQHLSVHHTLLLLSVLKENSQVVHIPKVLYSRTTNKPAGKPGMQAILSDILHKKTEKRGYSCHVKFSDENKEEYIVDLLPKQEEKVSIIIPTKDSAKLVKQCVDSILYTSLYKNIEIIIIDNNSEEDAFFELIAAYKKEHGEKIKCYRKEIPFNFSLLVNEGVKYAEGNYVVLLNNDTKIITADWIEKMLGYAQLEDVGVVGVKLLYPDQSVQHAGVVLGIGGIASHVFLYEDRYSTICHNYINSIINYSALTAACIMVSKAKYLSVEGFDTVFASDYNDIDFCLKLRDKKYYNIYLPQVELYHYESISRGRSNSNATSYQRYIQETNLFKKRWGSILQQDPFYNENLSKKSLYFELE